MIAALRITHNKLAPLRMALLLYLVYAATMLLALRSYIAWQSVNVVLGLLALPFVTTLETGNRKHTRHAVAALFFAVAAIGLPVKTLLYFAIVFGCFFVTESCLGGMNQLPVLVAMLMSPVCQFTANVFSFPIRLQLTGWAGSMLHVLGERALVKGNMIVYHGNEFSVDPACMGLHMMVTSLLLQLVIIAVYQKKHGRQLVWWQVWGLLAITFGLNVISNLFRIIVLVWFTILPGTSMHELAGIVCLLLYVIIPVTGLTNWMVKQKGRIGGEVTGKFTALSSGSLMKWHILLLVVVGLSAWQVIRHEKMIDNMPAHVVPLAGYRTQKVTTEIIKLQNSCSLVYIKYIPGFYNADHHPMICWEGSGYQFKQVQQETIGQQQVYTALLQNGKEQLYTAWWYDNGVLRTTDQLRWRWLVLTGAKPFSVVNITTASKQQLINETESVLRDNRLRPLL